MGQSVGGQGCHLLEVAGDVMPRCRKDTGDEEKGPGIPRGFNPKFEEKNDSLAGELRGGCVDCPGVEGGRRGGKEGRPDGGREAVSREACGVVVGQRERRRGGGEDASREGGAVTVVMERGGPDAATEGVGALGDNEATRDMDGLEGATQGQLGELDGFHEGVETRRAGGAGRGDIVGDGIIGEVENGSAADRVPVRVEKLSKGKFEGLEFLPIGRVVENMGLPLAHPHGGGEAHLEGATGARATTIPKGGNEDVGPRGARRATQIARKEGAPPREITGGRGGERDVAKIAAVAGWGAVRVDKVVEVAEVGVPDTGRSGVREGLKGARDDREGKGRDRAAEATDVGHHSQSTFPFIRGHTEGRGRAGVENEPGVLGGLGRGDKFLGVAEKTHLEGKVHKKVQSGGSSLESGAVDEEVIDMGPNPNRRGTIGSKENKAVAEGRVERLFLEFHAPGVHEGGGGIDEVVAE